MFLSIKIVLVTIIIAIVSYINIVAIWAWMSSIDTDIIMIITAIASILIALISGVIAIIALKANIRSGEETRKHNKLSVLPLLAVERKKIEKKDRNNHKLILVNNGVGPAIIESFALYFKDREISCNDVKAYENFLENDMKRFNCQHTSHGRRGVSLGAGERKTLWEFEYNLNTKDIEDIQELTVRVKYQSIYKDEIFSYPPE